VTLGVYWDRARVGELELAGEKTREYRFRYLETDRPISLSLPTDATEFTPAQSRPFFEALLPEGVVREQIASSLKLAASDSYGLLAELGRDCAGALQIVEHKRLSDTPSVRWLNSGELDQLVRDLPQRPLGIDPADQRLRLSLAGVQRKAVVVRDREGRFGEPLNGMPSTHILKPQLADEEYPDIAYNEFFCMRLARRCGLSAAKVELINVDGRACVVVERFDRDTASSPARRLHQEDLCQALGLTPDFKYQRPGWTAPSYAALAAVLDEHSLQPGVDRLAAAQATLFNFLVANADAHAKNISLLHEQSGVRLAPLYDLVCIGAYPEVSAELALSIGDEFDPIKIGAPQWSDLAFDFRLQPRAFERARSRLAAAVPSEAARLAEEARAEGWHRPVHDTILELVSQRSKQL
jgi:serine/threonine-protein kinase HipA